MPVTALLPSPPPIPAAGSLAQAAQPGLAAEVAATGDPVDRVSLSPAAVLQRVLDAPGVAMQQLGSLLQEVEQITQLTSSVAPLMMGELAAEIGTAASELGAGVQALLPPPDKVQTSLQLAAAAALRALETLTPALHRTGGDGVDPAPAMQAGRETLAGESARAWPSGAPAPAAAAQANRTPASAHLSDAPGLPALPYAGDLPGELSAGVPAPGHDMPVIGPTTEGSPPGEGAGPGHEVRPDDPARKAQADARAILRSAADTLGRMQLGLDAASAAAAHVGVAVHASVPQYDRAWCEAQIAVAQAQVTRASCAIESLPCTTSGRRPMAALLDQHGVALAGMLSRHKRLLRVGGMLVLLCVAATALWAASRLDLTLARIAAAGLIALAGLAWTWHRRALWHQPRLRIEIRR